MLNNWYAIEKPGFEHNMLKAFASRYEHTAIPMLLSTHFLTLKSASSQQLLISGQHMLRIHF